MVQAEDDLVRRRGLQVGIDGAGRGARHAGIRRIAENSSLPINVMVMNGVSPVSKLAKLGVARVSYGPIPFVEAMGALQKKADKALS